MEASQESLSKKKSSDLVRSCPIKIFIALVMTIIAARSVCAAPLEDEMLARRMANVYVEGMVLDELVLGARAKLSFFYTDAKLDAAVQKLRSNMNGPISPEVAARVADYTGRFGARSGKAYFTIAIETFKSWSFDTGEITIAGWHPSKEDVLTGLMGQPAAEVVPGPNEIAKDYSGIFAVYVPAELVPPGSEIEIGYGEHTVSWKVPTAKE